MNRTEYMEKLKEALAEFDEGVAAEIISDYEEHFDMGAASGRSEEEIAAELGSIEELVNELKGLSSDKGNKTYGFSDIFGKDNMNININTTEVTENLKKGLDLFISSAGKLAGELGVVLTNASETIRAKQETRANTPEPEENFTFDFSEDDEVVVEDGNEKSISFDADGEQAEEASAEATGSASYSDNCAETAAKTGIDTVLIEGGCADVTVFYNAEGTVTFDYKNEGNQNQQLAYRFYHRVDGNTIRAGVCKADAISGFFNRLASPRITLRVGIPRGLKKVSVKNSSGNITFADPAGQGSSDGFELGTLSLVTVSGDVKIDPVSIKDFSANTASGDFDIKGLVTDGAYINTASGDISAAGVEAEDFKLNTVSGDITMSGAIDKLKVHSVSGDIDAVLTEAEFVDVSTVSGDIKAALDEVSGYTAAVKTTSGNVTLKYAEESRHNVNNGSYSFGEGGTKLNLNTVSGDINVK